MLRKDREITERAEIIDVLKRCDTISVGLFDEEYPYVVPFSFGYEDKDGELSVFIHGAKIGKKIELIEKNPHVCVEGHIFIEVTDTPHGVTTLYESIIAYGKIERITGEEALAAMRNMLARYDYADYPLNEKKVALTAVYKIVVSEITGKRNLPKESS